MEKEKGNHSISEDDHVDISKYYKWMRNSRVYELFFNFQKCDEYSTLFQDSLTRIYLPNNSLFEKSRVGMV